MDPLFVTLLVEACFVLLAVLCVIFWLQLRTKNKSRNLVEQLITQIKQESNLRTKKIEWFLQQNYELSESELASTVTKVDKQERALFQKLIGIVTHKDVTKISHLSTAIIELMDTYKDLTPKATSATLEAQEAYIAKIKALEIENSGLKEEMKNDREIMSSMAEEFGNMFGGGQDHKMNTPDVVSKVVSGEVAKSK